MKKIISALEWLFWPVAFLFLKKMPLLHRIGFFAVGIINMVSFPIVFWLTRGFSPIWYAPDLIFAGMAIILVADHICGYSVYSIKRKRLSRESADIENNDIRPMSDSTGGHNREIKRSQPLSTKDILATLKKMKEHGKRARVAWCLSQGGGIFIFPDT